MMDHIIRHHPGGLNQLVGTCDVTSAQISKYLAIDFVLSHLVMSVFIDMDQISYKYLFYFGTTINRPVGLLSSRHGRAKLD